MSTRNLIIGLLFIAGITFLLINPTPTVTNQRTNPNTTTAATEFTSSLETMAADETLTERLTDLQTATKKEPFDASSSQVQTGDNITVHYRGWLAKDGTVFDQSFNRGATFTFTVGQNVIQGWSQGVVGMRVGEIRRLKIPSSLGYGEIGAGSSIGPNEDLIFDVELVSIN